MKKIKYISLVSLKKNLQRIISDVYNENNEYVIMVDKEAKAKISPVNGKERARVIVGKEDKEENLKSFIE